MTPQKVINNYEYRENLRKFIERYESMTAEERAAQPRNEIVLDWTAEEHERFQAAAQSAGITLDELVERAVFVALKNEYNALLSDGSTNESSSMLEEMAETLESMKQDTSLIENAVKWVERNKS